MIRTTVASESYSSVSDTPVFPILIVGGTDPGQSLGRRLVEAGHPVTLISRHRFDRRHIPSGSYTTMVIGDPRKPRTLERAGIGQAEVVVVVTENETDNLLVALTAKQTFSVPLVLALVNDRTQAHDYLPAGVEIVSTEQQAEGKIRDRIAESDSARRSIESPSDGAN